MIGPEKYAQIALQMEEQGFSPDEIKKEMDSRGLSPEESIGDMAKGAIVDAVKSTPVDAALRVMDYPAGLVRGAIGGAAEIFTDKNLVDLEEVIKGKAPSFDKMAERGGIPKGTTLSEAFPGHVKKGGIFDVSPRGVAGGIMDMAYDPLNFVGGLGAAGKGGRAISKLAKAASPTETAVNKLGKKIYDSGLKNVARDAAKFGGKSTESVTDTFRKHGLYGSLHGGIDPKVNPLINNLADTNKQISNVMTKNQVPVDLDEAAKGAMKELDEIITFKNKRHVSEDKFNTAVKLKKDITKYLNSANRADKVVKKEVNTGLIDFITGKPTKRIEETIIPGKPHLDMNDATKMKNNIYDEVSNAAFKEGTDVGLQEKIYKKFSLGLRDQMEKSINDFDPKLGKIYRENNKDISNLMASKKALGTEGSREIRKDLVSTVGAMSWATSPMFGTVKTVADVAKMPAVRTTLGMGLMKGSKPLPMFDAMLRQYQRTKDNQQKIPMRPGAQ